MRGLALGLWAVVLLQSSVDGRLDLLLRAAFHPLVSSAGGVLLMLAVVQVLAGLRQWRGGSGGGGSGGGEPPSRQERRLSIATAAIAALIIALPANPSFADLASQRPADDTAADTLSFVLPPAQRSLTDWVRLLRSKPDPKLFDEDPVRISGFVLPMPDGPPELARLLVRCCLADATPVGLPVRWPAGEPLPQADQWLAIEGRMAIENDQLQVVPESIRPIPRPARPLEP